MVDHHPPGWWKSVDHRPVSVRLNDRSTRSMCDSFHSDGGSVSSAIGVHESDVVLSHSRYRKSFTSPSVGTEEELKGVKVKMQKDASSLLGFIRHVEAENEVLVEITRDMGDEESTQGTYTIELRTTPTELEDKAGWLRRTTALHYATLSLNMPRPGALQNDTYGKYQLVMENVHHTVLPVGQVPGADRQMTVAVAAADLGLDAHERSNGRLHPLVSLPWYCEAFFTEVRTEWDECSSFAYAFVMSAMLKLASLWARYPKDRPNLVVVKNSWIVRPRTQPFRILAIAPEGAPRRQVLARLMSADFPESIAKENIGAELFGATMSHWEGAREYILGEGSLGGHNPPVATVGDRFAMLFEYRTAPQDKTTRHLFWDPSGSYDVEV
jgi:hypothetical protein